MSPTAAADSIDNAAVLATLPGWAFAFALLLARVGAACMMLPGIGEAELPTSLRLGFVLALVALLLPTLAPSMPAPPADPWRLAGMMIAELVAGLWLGWLARLLLLALPMGGQIIASMVGMANVLQPDPTMGPQTAALSRLLALAAPVAVLISGLHALPLAALVGSYRLVAPGTLLASADGLPGAVDAVSDAFGLALRLAAPFLLASIVWQAGLGLVTRLIPQLQVYFVAAPGQILGGILLLGLLAATLVQAWSEHLASGFAGLPGL